ncbi:diacylglycerol kinase, partial [Enterococcus durans]
SAAVLITILVAIIIWGVLLLS